LDTLKQWLEQRRQACTKDARDFGLPPLKGLALIGIPGTGKSSSAIMTASMWQMPLIRLDVGGLFGSLVGETEAATRQALRIVEAVAPCIVWIDELEKAMSRGGLDGGTSDRVFGTILTWMAEKTAPCFVVATANDISKLPPELLRKGRFDEVFFLDLPTQAERREIFAVHLKKRGRNARAFNLDLLSQAANGYVGAEIEQAVTDALFLAYNEGKRDLKTDDIVNALKTQVPLSVSQRETIENLRQWLRDGRARAASGTDGYLLYRHVFMGGLARSNPADCENA
jgi:SpoVK/Ycf46/Vps4 family AAA+-type ATPase